jgi:hypothetical protein
MKKIIFLFVAFLLSQSTFAQDFRNVAWGTSQEEVKVSENINPLAEDKESLLFKVQLAGKEVTLVYKFLSPHGLYSSGYLFDEKHTNKNNFIDDYDEIKSLLIKKYGPPTVERVIWLNDLFKDDPKDFGMAVSIGHLKYISSWKVEETNISLGLVGDNYKISMLLNYKSERF